VKVLRRRHREAHVQEVGGEVEIVARIDEGLADGILEGHRGDGRHLGDQAPARDHALVGIVDVGRVVVEGRQRADHAAHHRHRVGVTPEPREQVAELLVDHGVMGDGVLELGVLLGARQFAVQQQVGDFEERALLGELVDGIAAVEQDALVAVDVGDLGLAAGGRGEAGVVGELAGLGVELGDVDHARADGACHHGEFVRAARGFELGGRAGLLVLVRAHQIRLMVR
jgi:hypothetical protein